MSTSRQVLPEGLAHMPPGPELAAVLASVDRSRLFGADLYTVLRAQARQVAHEQARLMADMVEAAYCPGEGETLDRVRSLDEFSGDQIAFELTWSRAAASGQLAVARELLERLPIVYEAFSAGRIDLVKARAFAEALSCLDDETARAVAARLVGKAEAWTAGQLRERLRYQVLRADPSQAKIRYQHAVTDRRVYHRPYTDGTAELGAVNLPPDRAAAAANRIDRLASAARAAGDVRTLAQLRADALLDLLAGVPFQLQPSTDPITAAADTAARESARAAGLAPDLDEPALPPAAPTRRRRTGGRPTGGGYWARPSDSTVTSTPGGRRGATLDSILRSGSDEDHGAAEDGPIGSGAFGELADAHYDPLAPAGGPCRPKTGKPAPHPEPDPVPVASDDPRMCVCGGIQPAARRGVVDLQIAATTLMCLDDNPGLIPGWGPVIADIARQVAFDQETNPMWRWSVLDRHGNLLHHGHTSRRPTATEKAFVKARDRTCKAPGCRRPAMNCDDDHRQEWANGGPSHRGNLCVLCRHHHRLRHERGYVVHQMSAGMYLWDTPNRRRYLVLPDGNLILTAEDVEPGPPPGYVDQYIPDDTWD